MVLQQLEQASGNFIPGKEPDRRGSKQLNDKGAIAMKQFEDIKTLKDLPCPETRIFLELRRKRLELQAKVAAYNLLKNPLVRDVVAMEVGR